MLRRFLPKQDGFFELFQKMADLLVLATTQFNVMVMDLEKCTQYVAEITQHEKDTNKIILVTINQLHKTFITPFDRHDIHRYTRKMDSIVDDINRCAQRFPFYHLKTLPAELIDLSEIALQCAKILKKATYRLHTLEQAQEILKFCEEVDILENKAQYIALSGERNLFLDENDFKTFFKLKEIYKRINSVICGCKDAADIIKGIVLEYS